MDKENNILADWLSGKISKAELENLKKDKGFSQYKKIVSELDKLTAPEYNPETEWSSLQGRIHSKPKVIKFKRIIYSVAASVVIFISTFFFLNQNTEKVVTIASQKQAIELPDGSEVTLNSASKIKYNVKKWGEERKITLTGEAFFEVEKGSRFVVETKHGSVEVLGTSFNVYGRETFEVVCFTGKVRVNSAKAKEPVDLTPGKKASLIKANFIQENVENDIKPSWVLGESRFKSAPLERVIQELEIQYNIKFVYNELPQMKFSGTIPHSDLKLALRIVFEPLGIKYKAGGKNKIILTYSK